MGDRNEVFFKMKSPEIYRIFTEGKCGISVDSRSVSEGNIFFALRGESFDGNQFASEALSRGASLAVIDNKDYCTEGTLLVKDALSELQALASAYRRNMAVPLLAITGSNGKTTSKELITRTLSGKKKIHYTSGNLNNHIGVPLTLLSAPSDTEFIIIEMGANHVGEIKQLCEIAAPQYGIITNMGKAHLEGFGSFNGVIEAKSELYKYLSESNGLVFFNPDDEILTDILSGLKVDSRSYYELRQGKIDIVSVKADPFLTIAFELDGSMNRIESKLFGKYNLENILAALCTGSYFGAPFDEMIEAIESYQPENNRSQILVTGSNTLICDAYNANPVSMRNAIISFMEAPGGGKTMILGDMLELGEYSSREHSDIVDLIMSFDEVIRILVGPLFSAVATGRDITLFNDTSELIKYLSDNPIKDNFVLVKGSRVLKMEEAFKYL
ncbi:MAG TPA: UDP-N-acetylmuramoyl-tripeptide--D-alanyl-D-alanine ligase [Bacteroidales bacterium]|nr:UDP-N-acetylmuramoyl-tripeptide--D-alanyl-D-alanine ligase [Bacteroidales bacterium]